MKIKNLNKKECDKIGLLTDKLIYECDKSVLISDINELISIRKAWKISQQELSDCFKVSLRTIQRFEKLEVDSLSLYLNYKEVFK